MIIFIYSYTLNPIIESNRKVKRAELKNLVHKNLNNNSWEASNFNDKRLIHVIPKESEIAYKKGCKGGQGG